MSRGVLWACIGCRQELGRQTERAFHPARRVVPIPLTAGGALIVCPHCGTRLQWQPRHREAETPPAFVVVRS